LKESRKYCATILIRLPAETNKQFFMLGYILSFLLVYKYLALFLIAVLASLAIPLPSSAILLASGAFAAQGYLNFYGVLLVSWLGNIIGDSILYFIARYYGKAIFLRIGLKRLLISKKFIWLEGRFADHSASAIFLSRFFIPSLGSPVDILAGLAKISFKKFIFLEITGELIYEVLYGGLGYLFGSQWQNIYKISENLTLILIISILLLILLRLSLKKKLSLKK
jgi:membrane protein DedA with SNARE-associated domain